VNVGRLRDHPRPVPIDPRGVDLPGQAERLRALGDVVAVELLGGVRAWMPTSQGVLEPLLMDSRVSRDARRHWGDLRSGWLAEHPDAHWMYGLLGDSMFWSNALNCIRCNIALGGDSGIVAGRQPPRTALSPG